MDFFVLPPKDCQYHPVCSTTNDDLVANEFLLPLLRLSTTLRISTVSPPCEQEAGVANSDLSSGLWQSAVAHGNFFENDQWIPVEIPVAHGAENVGPSTWHSHLAFTKSWTILLPFCWAYLWRCPKKSRGNTPLYRWMGSLGLLIPGRQLGRWVHQTMRSRPKRLSLTRDGSSSMSRDGTWFILYG